MVSTLEASVETRLAKYKSMETFRIAAALDPRYKLDWCDETEQSAVIDLVMESLVLTTTATTPADVVAVASPPPLKHSRLMGFMAKARPSSTSSSAPDERIYFQEAVMDEQDDPLKYWKENGHRFSRLAWLACRVLAIPASSAPVERVFSVAGKIFHPERCALVNERFEDLMVIRCNSKADWAMMYLAFVMYQTFRLM